MAEDEGSGSGGGQTKYVIDAENSGFTKVRIGSKVLRVGDTDGVALTKKELASIEEMDGVVLKTV